MVVQHARAEDDVHFANPRERDGRRAVAEHELDARSPRRALSVELRSRAEDVDAVHLRRARVLGDERVLSVDAPHAADIREGFPWRLAPDVLRQPLVLSRPCAAPTAPVAPHVIEHRTFEGADFDGVEHGRHAISCSAGVAIVCSAAAGTRACAGTYGAL